MDKQQLLRALERRVERGQGRLRRLRERSDRYSQIRLVVFAAGLVLSVVAVFVAGPGAFWVPLLAMAIVFAIVVAAHGRVNRAARLIELWVAHQQAQVARARLDWPHIPPAASEPARAQHPFAPDLNLTGERSLHQLLDVAVTAEGSRRLADWLERERPDAALIAQRQRLVKELAAHPHVMTRLVVNGQLSAREEGAPSGPWQASDALSGLPQKDERAAARTTFIGALVAMGAGYLFLVLDIAGVIATPIVWVAAWLIYIGLFFTSAGRVREMFKAAFETESALRRFADVFGYLEREPFSESPRLQALCQPFALHAPARLLRRTRAVLAGAGLQGNIFLWLPVNLLVPWDLFFAWQLRRCQAELSARLPGWLDTWFELEALAGLSNYAFLNPGTAFARVDGTAAGAAAGAVFHARDLGHPLIPVGQRVGNDFDLAAIGDAVLLTGSNMSGKSTFLRALGLNLCLAYAGGPVCASALETRLFRLFTCIAVSDSVVDGISHFYAEVKRLRLLLDDLAVVDEVPLFFLIDEIYRGTNNRERLIGSRSFTRAVIGRNGVGVITTHDLELTRLADELPRVRNGHFRERVADGRMVFDYRLRQGPSPSTNALTIMRLEGLPVEDDGRPSTNDR